MQTLQDLIQTLNIVALITIVIAIFLLFTERTLTICIAFRIWGITKRQAKVYFSLLAVTTIVRLAAYIVDFTTAGSPPFAIFFNAVIAAGMAAITVRIYKRRKAIKKKIGVTQSETNE